MTEKTTKKQMKEFVLVKGMTRLVIIVIVVKKMNLIENENKKQRTIKRKIYKKNCSLGRLVLMTIWKCTGFCVLVQ